MFRIKSFPASAAMAVPALLLFNNYQQPQTPMCLAQPPQVPATVPVSSPSVSNTVLIKAPPAPVRNFLRRFFPTDSHHFSKYTHSQSLHPNTYLPLPGLMSYPSLTSGLVYRQKDEALLAAKQEEMSKAAAANDREAIGVIASEISTIAYGPSANGTATTPDSRRIFLEQHGCAKHSDVILSTIANLANERLGVVEMGCGNGQWSRILRDKYKVDVLAFDNMSALPLNVSLYHNRTQPNADYFFTNILNGDHRVFYDPRKQQALKGRVLLIVFPDPSRMATMCLVGYTDVDDDNDTFVYVGEGRGGANGDDKLFDELESGRWRLQMIEDVEGFGNKGYEKCFVFKRFRKQGDAAR